MPDRMQPVDFKNLLNWIVKEFSDHKTICGIPYSKFFFNKNNISIKLFDENLDMPIGPAAGPQTQLAQNIVASYLTGGRFFELKTVQKLDDLKIDKPCIDVEDEGYNVEWSQELTLEQSYSEYLKAWFLLHFLNALFSFSKDINKGFIFNMSVGYDLDGIKTEKMNNFIEKLKDASTTEEFHNIKKILLEFIDEENLKTFLQGIHPDKINSSLDTEKLLRLSKDVSAFISNSVTLSTMHGCSSNEIEAIAKYLIKEKKLHTFIKLNPTLLGFDYVKKILSQLGYAYIDLAESSFTHDLQFGDAIPMIKRLKDFSIKNERIFGIKLSNTLGVNNQKENLPGEQMYMSGRSLYPLTINLASKIANELNGEINISYSGGATVNNINQILETGIYPVTLVTELLKPGGYLRLTQISEKVEQFDSSNQKINLTKLKELAKDSLIYPEYKKEKREVGSLKINKRLNKFDCYIAPCVEVCPIHQDVPEYINLVGEEHYEDAFEIIASKNPLPHITGYICDHQCMTKCVRWDYDNSIQIRELKKEAAEKGFENYIEKHSKDFKVKKISIKAAVIGAGPAGLSAAYFLAKAGFDVTIFEKTNKSGGTVQHVIPGFRMPQSSIENDIDFVKKFGVNIIYNSDSDFSISKLKSEGYKYVFIGTGAPNSNKLNINTNNKIYNAVEFLKEFNRKTDINLGETVAVIGGGNSAMDSARASHRIKGVKSVYLIYRRTKEFMPADIEEFDAAVNEGVIFKELLLPVSFLNDKLKCQKMKLGEVDTDGRRKVFPLENEFEVFEIDSIISAIGEHVDINFLKMNKIINDDEPLKVNPETNETKIENIYIGGDALRGPSTVVESVADGKKAAEAIMKKEVVEVSEFINENLSINKEEKILSIEEKRGNVFTGNFADINLEADKCLECNLLCNKCVEVCPNRANVAIKTYLLDNELKDYYQILHVDGLCNDCGNCETFCPYSDAPYKEKTTLFWDINDFTESKNDGFYFEGNFDNQNKFIIRFNSQVSNISIDKEGKIISSSFDEDTNEYKTFINFIYIIFTNYNYLMNEKSKL